jgi:hypothetical protein
MTMLKWKGGASGYSASGYSSAHCLRCITLVTLTLWGSHRPTKSPRTKINGVIIKKMVAAVKKMNVNKLFLSHSSRGGKNLLGWGGMMIWIPKRWWQSALIIIPCAEPERNEMRSKKKRKRDGPWIGDCRWWPLGFFAIVYAHKKKGGNDFWTNEYQK